MPDSEAAVHQQICHYCQNLIQHSQASILYAGCGHRMHVQCAQNARRAGEARQRTRNIALAAAGCVGGVVFAPLVAPVVLGAVGLGAGGVIAVTGSLAAGLQSAIGNVAAGSLFAVCQAVGAGAALPAAGILAGGAAGAVGGAAWAAGPAQDGRCPVCVYGR